MTRNTILVGALCALATACSGGDAGGRGESQSAAATSGGDRAQRYVPDVARPDPAEARSIAAIPDTEIGMVHDEDEASFEATLPTMDDPLDLQRREPITEDLTVQFCPTDLRGLAARQVDVPGGAALELTAQGDSVDDLRARMQRFASSLRERRADHPFSGTDVYVVLIPNGVRLIAEALTMDHVRGLSALRDGMRADAEDLQRGRCPLSLQAEG